MIHTIRTITVGQDECVIDRPIMLYRGDRDLEVEFSLVGNSFMFGTDGNVLASMQAKYAQLVVNTPSGLNMFSDIVACRKGNVIFTIRGEMIDEIKEVGIYAFQIRLLDATQTSRVTLPPVYNGIEIRQPIAAEDQENITGDGVVDYAEMNRYTSESGPTFNSLGDYNKTTWQQRDIISTYRMNKIEDALYQINEHCQDTIDIHENQIAQLEANYNAGFENINKNINERIEYMQGEVNEAEAAMNAAKSDMNVAKNDMLQTKNEVIARVDQAEEDLAAQVDADVAAAEVELKEYVDGAMDEELAEISDNISAFVNIMQYKNLVSTNVDSSGEEFEDWTTAIQTAINENDRVEFPSGIFGVTSPIRIRDYKIIRGNGRKTQIISKTNMSCVLDVDNYDQSISYTEIENIFINGNDLAEDGIHCVGFTNNSLMSRLWIENCLENGIYLTKSWYSKLEKMQIRYCNNGITVTSSSANSENQTGNVNIMHFTDMYIAFIDNNGINFDVDSGYGNMISNSTIEACAGHGIYINNIISTVTCENIYMEAINLDGYHVDSGRSINIIGGYVNVENITSRSVYVGNINRLMIRNLSMSNWHHAVEYMIYSLAKENDIYCDPLSAVTKRTIYYTGKFKGNVELIMSADYGTDFNYDVSSLATKKIELVETAGYGKNINAELIRGSAIHNAVDPSRVYQYVERTTIEGGWGACKTTMYAKVNDGSTSGTEKEVYNISNGYFVPTTMKFVGYTTANRPTSHEIGMVIYDITIKKPIVWNGSDWTDFMGNIV